MSKHSLSPWQTLEFGVLSKDGRLIATMTTSLSLPSTESRMRADQTLMTTAPELAWAVEMLLNHPDSQRTKDQAKAILKRAKGT